MQPSSSRHLLSHYCFIYFCLESLIQKRLEKSGTKSKLLRKFLFSDNRSLLLTLRSFFWPFVSLNYCPCDQSLHLSDVCIPWFHVYIWMMRNGRNVLVLPLMCVEPMPQMSHCEGISQNIRKKFEGILLWDWKLKVEVYRGCSSGWWADGVVLNPSQNQVLLKFIPSFS